MQEIIKSSDNQISRWNLTSMIAVAIIAAAIIAAIALIISAGIAEASVRNVVHGEVGAVSEHEQEAGVADVLLGAVHPTVQQVVVGGGSPDDSARVSVSDDVVAFVALAGVSSVLHRVVDVVVGVGWTEEVFDAVNVGGERGVGVVGALLKRCPVSQAVVRVASMGSVVCARVFGGALAAGTSVLHRSDVSGGVLVGTDVLGHVVGSVVVVAA